VTRPDSVVLTLKTNMILRKGATFHSPTSPASPENTSFRPPSLPRRSQTNLDDVIDSHRRRAALALGNFDKSITTCTSTSSSSPKKFRDNSLPIPRGILDHTVDSSIMSKQHEVEGRVLRPRTRRPSRHADSGLGTSIATSNEKQANASSEDQKSVRASALTRSAAAGSTTSASLPALSERALSRIVEHVLKPLLAKPAFKDFHPVVLECPRKIKENEIVCLRDVEKTLLLLAPERTRVPKIYLDFCLTTVRCIQATVDYINERERTRPRDLPYTSGYFVDLVDQIHQYAKQLAEAQLAKGIEVDDMDVDPTVEIKLHGGLRVNGRQAELVRVKENGEAFSLATGQPVDVVDEEIKDSVRIKRSMSETLEDDESIMRSMARRKKNATPEELAPKKCREPGCNKEFKRPCDLTKHEKTHSRPWKCPVVTCKYHDYGWPTEKEMDRHHNDKHSAAPPMYHCHYKPCPYKSKRQSNCKQHMEKAHGWTYVRTKTNGKKGPSISGGSVTQSTPQLHNLPTPEYSIGVATPPNDSTATFPGLFDNHSLNSLDFPAYNSLDPTFDMIPQDLQLDFSPIDHTTPSTDSGADRNSAYQDIGNDFTLDEDIYAATVQIPAHLQDYYTKGFVMQQQFGAFSAPEMHQPQAAPHLSPIGQGNTMLYTPTSMAEVDEGFVDDQDYNMISGSGDFVLYDDGSLQKPSLFNNSLFSAAEVPSLTAGFSQPNSQDIMSGFPNMDWSAEDYQPIYPQFNPS
jgi:hypothetical protein